MDGAYYIDDYTDRSSGVQFGEARIRIFSTLGKQVDFKFDVDLAPSRATLKDVYLRWHTNTNGFLRIGNFIEPFSAENIQSSYDDRFMAKSATVEALGTGRTLGVSYRYYHPYFWGEAGVFSQRYNSELTKGDMGYAIATRLLARYTSKDVSIHVGGSLNYRRPDANGFASGNDDYNRFVTPVSSLESAIDRTPFLGGQLNNVQHTFKYALELMASYRQFYLTAEYLNANNKRARDWESMYNAIKGTFTITMAPTMDAYKTLLGGDPDVELQGYTVQAGWLLRGGNYRYSAVDALMSRPGAGALELTARFNRTELESIVPGSVYSDGKFYTGIAGTPYDAWTVMGLGIANSSWSGGNVSTLTVGLNYYVTKSIAVKLNYSYASLDRPYSMTYRYDKNLHALQARVAFEF
jgi:phosphate-selective porin OprO/OprP